MRKGFASLEAKIEKIDARMERGFASVAEDIGNLATKDLRDNATGPRGVWTGSTAEGLPVLGAYARSVIADT